MTRGRRSQPIAPSGLAREPSPAEDAVSARQAGALRAQEVSVALIRSFASGKRRCQASPMRVLLCRALLRQALHGRAQPSPAQPSQAPPPSCAPLSGAVDPNRAGQSVAFAGAAGPSTAMSGAAELSPAAPGAAEPSTAVSGVAVLEAPCPRPGTREPSRADLDAWSEASTSSARLVSRPSTGFCPSPTPSTFPRKHADQGATLSVFSAYEARS